MRCNHLPSPGLCEVFELWIDRANEVELLFASPALELFFPSDGCANVFVTLKVEQALAAIGRSETFQWQIQVAGDAKVKRAPDIARCQQSLLSAPGNDRGGPARCGLQ